MEQKKTKDGEFMINMSKNNMMEECSQKKIGIRNLVPNKASQNIQAADIAQKTGLTQGGAELICEIAENIQNYKNSNGGGKIS